MRLLLLFPVTALLFYSFLVEHPMIVIDITSYTHPSACYLHILARHHIKFMATVSDRARIYHRSLYPLFEVMYQIAFRI